MDNTEKKLNSIFLLPGEVCAVNQPAYITTLLGSCVAVCLWDIWGRIAGMNHFLLPKRTIGNDANTRYGDVAINSLIKSMVQLVSKPQTLKAQIFGGGAVVERLNCVGNGIGRQNIKLAEEMLTKYGIRIAHCDIGGNKGRKICLDSTTGEVMVKMIKMSNDK